MNVMANSLNVILNSYPTSLAGLSIHEIHLTDNILAVYQASSYEEEVFDRLGIVFKSIANKHPEEVESYFRDIICNINLLPKYSRLFEVCSDITAHCSLITNLSSSGESYKQ